MGKRKITFGLEQESALRRAYIGGAAVPDFRPTKISYDDCLRELRAFFSGNTPDIDQSYPRFMVEVVSYRVYHPERDSRESYVIPGSVENLLFLPFTGRQNRELLERLREQYQYDMVITHGRVKAHYQILEAKLIGGKS
jgi:hypothetical protein